MNPTIIHQDIIKYGYHKGEKRIVVKEFYDGMYPAAFHHAGSILICGMCELDVHRMNGHNDGGAPTSIGTRVSNQAKSMRSKEWSQAGRREYAQEEVQDARFTNGRPPQN